MFRKRLPLSELPEPLAPVLEHWRRRGGETLGCSWSRFELHKLPARVLPTALVVDVYPDMDKNRFRYWGSKMTEIHGRDMTGFCPYDLTPRDLAQDLREQHLEIITEKAARADILGFQHDRGFRHMHTILRLPLSDDGVTVNHIVGVIWFTPKSLDTMERDGGGVTG